MKGVQGFISLLCILTASSTDALSLYEHYNPTAINPKSGLEINKEVFKLNDKPIQIISGSFHYFRVHPDYWRITLRKMKAAGLNTVTTYMPWNLHNPRNDTFDFGSTSPFLDIQTFVIIAKEEDLFVIIRPGPFIGADWEFGGMPSWLLKDVSMQVRSLYPTFKNAVTVYFTEIRSMTNDHLYINNGSIIAMQIENDYGYFGYNDFPRQKEYLQFIEAEINNIGLFNFTSDTILEKEDLGSSPGVLQAANIHGDVKDNLRKLKELQPGMPMMIMDFSIVSLDHWITGYHNQMTTDNIDDYIEDLKTILKEGASVNIYMFAGGTNFGFMAGANLYEDYTSCNEFVPIMYSPVTTSYDYDAPISESGEYMEKYSRISAAIQEHYDLWNEIALPSLPTERIKGDAKILSVSGQKHFDTLVEILADTVTNIPLELTDGPTNMENLQLHENDGLYVGQSYGYILYEASVLLDKTKNKIQIMGHIRDMAQLFVDGVEMTSMLTNKRMLDSFGYWQARNEILPPFDHPDTRRKAKIQILVENLGRVSFGKPHFFDQRKGLYEGQILINDVEQLTWMVTPMEFDKTFVESLDEWDQYTGDVYPAAYMFNYPLNGNPKDIYIDTSDWQKGVVFVNGFNLGRYWTALSPVNTMYLPAPLLNAGANNKIIIFEQYKPSTTLKLVTEASYNV